MPAEIQLLRNQLIRWDSPAKQVFIERLLELVPEQNAWAVIVMNDSKRGLPLLRKTIDIDEALRNGVASILTDDPYAYVQGLSDADLSPAQLAKRNAKWTVLAPFITDPSRPLFEPQARAKAISAIKAKSKISTATLYRDMRTYYVRGQTLNAFTTDYHRCGAPNESRKAGNKPRGRPPKYGKKVTNITPAILEKLILGLNQYFKDEGLPFSDALKETKRKYFVARLTWNGKRPDVALTDEGAQITEGQARYHYFKSRCQNDILIARVGIKRFNRDLRGLPNESTSLAFGPGGLYQIDATVADAWLIHPWTKKPIGRPTVYLIIDTYSHMVVGFHVTFESPSYMAAVLAFEQACRPKVEILTELGIDLDPELWPAQGMPQRVLGDRGEFVSRNSDRFCSELDCSLSNTAPYRADAKGIIEQSFRQTNLHTIQWLDGYVDRNRDRGDAHPKNVTTTTPRTFMQMLVIGIIERNRSRLNGYPLSREHYADGVEPRPVSLWEWGMANRSGQLRVLPAAQIRRRLLPREEARITAHGISFRGLHFESEQLPAAEVGTIERSAGRERITIAFDPRMVDKTYLVSRQVEAELEPLRLTPRSARFSGLSWVEMEALVTGQKVAANASAESDANRKASSRAYQEQIANADKAAHGGNHGSGVRAGKNHVRKLEAHHDGLANIPTLPPEPATAIPPSAPDTATAAMHSAEQARMADKLRKQISGKTDSKT